MSADSRDARRQRKARAFPVLRPGLLVLGLYLFTPFAPPAGAARVETKKSELNRLHGRIETLQRDLGKSEAAQAAVADQLREVESAISGVSRTLHQLAAERRTVEAQLAELEQQSQHLTQQTQVQQRQLGQLLGRQFAGGESEALSLLFSGRDPNQVARDHYFLTQLGRAKARLISQLQTAAAEKQRLAEAARERRTQLAAIERRQQDSQAQLQKRKAQRTAMLARLSGRIRAQRQEIGSLRRDEQRLTQLIDRLARTARQIPKPPSGASGKVGAGETATRSRLVVRNADPGAIGHFGALRGKLRYPVAGTLASRFGSPHGESGISAKGIFIRASEGAEVHAVSAGTVVFADWLRGFGNLLIIDHGEDFLSIYGYNEALLANAGSRVKSGETIATVGNSGGNPESGLYFELRHRGQAFDPVPWLGGR